MPKQIQTGAVTQALQRAFGFKGAYRPMLDEVIAPVYVIADPSPAQVTRLAMGTGEVDGADAPAIPFVQLFNPPDSGVICNLTHGSVFSNAKAEIVIRFHDLPGANQGNQLTFRDRRNQGEPACQIFVDNSQSSVGLTVAVLQIDGTLTQTGIWSTPGNDPRQPLAVLKPGTGVLLAPRTDTEIGTADFLRVNFQWIEVPIWDINPQGGLP